MDHIYLVVCPKCQHRQQTFTTTRLNGHCKCVYCGKLINKQKYNLGRVM